MRRTHSQPRACLQHLRQISPTLPACVGIHGRGGLAGMIDDANDSNTDCEDPPPLSLTYATTALTSVYY